MFKYLARHFSRLCLLAFSVDFFLLLFISILSLQMFNKIYLTNIHTIYSNNKGYLYLSVFITLSLIMLFVNELYNIEKKYKITSLFFKCTLSFLIVTLSCYILFRNTISFTYCFIIGMFACCIILLWRFLFYRIIPKINLQHKILFIGTDELSKKVVREILGEDHPKYKVVGFIGNDPDQVGKSIVNPKVLGLIDHMDSIIEKEKVKKIVASYSQARGSFPSDVLVKHKFNGIEVLDLHTFYEQLKGKILLDGLRPSWLIFAQGFKNTKLIKLEKRFIDVLCSIIGLIISLPIAIVTAILIKLDSRGPIIYKQERVGENGRHFNLYKFRSMSADAEKHTGPVWANENDDRITLVGKFIRKVRIDEIPQLINVLKGDMSFIGPRPERPYFVDMLSKKISYYDQRHSVKPGITGWAAVKYTYGASVEDAVEKLQYDLYYIKNLCLFLDFVIILKTFAIVLGRKGAR